MWLLNTWGERTRAVEKGPRAWDRPLYDFRGGRRGAGASATEATMAATIVRGF